jgi:hypothetical protein
MRKYIFGGYLYLVHIGYKIHPWTVLSGIPSFPDHSFSIFVVTELTTERTVKWCCRQLTSFVQSGLWKGVEDMGPHLCELGSGFISQVQRMKCMFKRHIKSETAQTAKILNA